MVQIQHIDKFLTIMTNLECLVMHISFMNNEKLKILNLAQTACVDDLNSSHVCRCERPQKREIMKE